MRTRGIPSATRAAGDAVSGAVIAAPEEFRADKGRGADFRRRLRAIDRVAPRHRIQAIDRDATGSGRRARLGVRRYRTGQSRIIRVRAPDEISAVVGTTRALALHASHLIGDLMAGDVAWRAASPRSARAAAGLTAHRRRRLPDRRHHALGARDRAARTQSPPAPRERTRWRRRAARDAHPDSMSIAGAGPSTPSLREVSDVWPAREPSKATQTPSSDGAATTERCGRSARAKRPSPHAMRPNITIVVHRLAGWK